MIEQHPVVETVYLRQLLIKQVFFFYIFFMQSPMFCIASSASTDFSTNRAISLDMRTSNMIHVSISGCVMLFHFYYRFKFHNENVIKFFCIKIGHKRLFLFML